MVIYLHIHYDGGDTSQQKTFRGKYELHSAGFSLWRETGYKGDISSGIKGGDIKVVLTGTGDSLLCRWVFSDSIRESGEVVTLDLFDRTVEKFSFREAKVKSYRILYDHGAERNLGVELIFSAEAIETDNDLFFEK